MFVSAPHGEIAELALAVSSRDAACVQPGVQYVLHSAHRGSESQDTDFELHCKERKKTLCGQIL